jgi:hypothetical protein
LTAGERGITIANLLRTRRFPWQDIAGFGYGKHGRAWCAEVELADGSKTPIRVLSDDLGTFGDPSERVSSVVADLRERLEAHAGRRSPAPRALALDDGDDARPGDAPRA